MKILLWTLLILMWLHQPAWAHPHNFYLLTWSYYGEWSGLTYVRHPETCETLKTHLIDQRIADKAFCATTFPLTAAKVTREVRRTYKPHQWHLWIRDGNTGQYHIMKDKAGCQRYAQAVRGVYERAICFSDTPRG